MFNSFIIRVYRADPCDYRKVVGLVETMDGSGVRATFDGIEDLAETISNLTVNGPAVHVGGRKSGGHSGGGASRRPCSKP